VSSSDDDEEKSDPKSRLGIYPVCLG
jgi:hypothetical protein